MKAVVVVPPPPKREVVLAMTWGEACALLDIQSVHVRRGTGAPQTYSSTAFFSVQKAIRAALDEHENKDHA